MANDSGRSVGNWLRNRNLAAVGVIAGFVSVLTIPIAGGIGPGAVFVAIGVAFVYGACSRLGVVTINPDSSLLGVQSLPLVRDPGTVLPCVGALLGIMLVAGGVGLIAETVIAMVDVLLPR
jgi:hypothetical protein